MQASSNRRLAIQLAVVTTFFGGFGFAMVPLYDVICRITGLNGRGNATAAALPTNTQVDVQRWVKVEFLAHSMPGVGLDLRADQFSMQVHPGGVIQANYTVRNTTDQVFTGQAVPSITPAVAAPHFRKIECFCFNQQTLQPGEARTLPIVFVVDRDLNPDIRTITLSYTFFEASRART